MNRLRRWTRWANQRSIPAAVAASALAALMLLAGPAFIGQRPTHRFLVWNLALAWIPFVAALVAADLLRRRRVIAGAAAAAVWLFFLPNAAYLVSDLTHFNRVSSTPWLDLSRLVAFAWAGALLGALSMRTIHTIVAARSSRITGWIVVVMSAFASGIGVALGRFARLNSWDVLMHPTSVLAEVTRIPESTSKIGLAGFVTLLMLVIYVALNPQPARGGT